MNDATIRAWWAHRQGLDGSLDGAAPAKVLERSGWARSVGGVGPYLTLFARAGTSREDADAAVARLEIHELPSARGCTYVVPASDFALALTVGQGFDGEVAVAHKLGVTDKEIDALCDAILKALKDETLTPDAIRERAGKAVRSLGEDGKKRGLATTLSLGLGRLQSVGQIRRVPTNGRLDQQRYAYALWKPSPLEKKSRAFADEAFTELARRFFRWIGPATVAEFQAFAGLGLKAAKDAVAPLKLVPLKADDERLMHAQDLDALRAYKAPREPVYTLVSSVDAIALHRRDAKSLLDTKDHARQVFGDRGMAQAGGLMDLPSHAILDRGRLVGLWEYDPSEGEIVFTAFCARGAALKKAVSRTEAFVKDQLGDARSFSLDSPKSRSPRIEALRERG